MVEVKQCMHHRSLSKAWSLSERGKAYIATKTSTDAYREELAKRNQTPLYKENQQRHDKTAKRKAYKRDLHSRRMDDVGHKLQIRIGIKLNRMLRLGDNAQESGTIKAFTQFDDHDDTATHFESTFADGMAWENYGAGIDTWNIGHRIARSMFDASNPEDVRRCWCKDNLFAQWEDENCKLGVRLPSSNDLLSMKHFFPVAWNAEVPSPERRVYLEHCAARGVHD